MNNSGAMITENKYRWMIWAIVVLAVMNITTLITILIQGSNSRETSAPVLSEKLRSEDPSIEFSGGFGDCDVSEFWQNVQDKLQP